MFGETYNGTDFGVQYKRRHITNSNSKQQIAPIKNIHFTMKVYL